MLKALKILLIPFSFLFAVIVKTRNLFYDKGILKSSKPDVKIISVGNITVGGTGKTPAVIYLVKLLKHLGMRPGILSRGYGRQSKGFKLVYDGSSLNCDVETCGDEIILEVQNCKAPAAVCEDRVEGAIKLLKSADIDSIVLDDAFQHRRIKRDIDIVLLDQEFLINASRLEKLHLPSGLFRESINSLRRADAVIINRKFSDEKEIPQNIKKIINEKIIFRANYEVEGLFDVKDYKYYSADEFIGQKSLVVSGIAKPDSFVDTLKSMKIDVTNRLIFKDHKNYRSNDIQEIRKRFYETNAYSVITTEKDAVKLFNFSKELDDIDIYFIRIKLVLEDENRFRKFLQLNIN